MKVQRLAIVLHNESDCELDRIPIEVREEQDESAVIGNAMISAIEGWTLNPGDAIKIARAD